jgi:hypothetical protein
MGHYDRAGVSTMRGKRVIGACASLAVVAAIAAGPPGLGQARDRTAAPGVAGRAEASGSAASAFAVFRRARVGTDALPEQLAAWLASPEADPALRTLRVAEARRAYAADGLEIHLIPRGDDGICMVVEHDGALGTIGCAPVKSASDSATPITARGSRQTIVVLPDGVDVRAADAAGARVPVTQGENVAVTRGGPADVSLAAP